MASVTLDDPSTQLTHPSFTQQSNLLHEWQARDRSEFVDAAPRNDRLRAIGQLTADFSHQVRTPLASLMLYAGQLDHSTQENKRLAAQITRGLHDLRRLASNMLGFAAGGREERQHLSVAELFADVALSFQSARSEKSRLTTCVADPSLTTLANRPALEGALLNLINNAREAGSFKTRVLLHARRYGNFIHFCVTDDGPGIAVDLQARVFEPFFTTQPQGTGLGLSIVDAVAKDHGGDVDLVSSNLGTSFRIRLPVVSKGEGRA